MTKEKTEQRRNQRFGGSMTKEEIKLLKQLAKKLRISRTELIVRSIQKYGEQCE